MHAPLLRKASPIVLEKLILHLRNVEMGQGDFKLGEKLIQRRKQETKLHGVNGGQGSADKSGTKKMGPLEMWIGDVLRLT